MQCAGFQAAACDLVAGLILPIEPAFTAATIPATGAGATAWSLESSQARQCDTMSLPQEVADAAEAGNLDAVRSWLDSRPADGGDWVNSRDENGWTLLLCCVMPDTSKPPHADLLRLLLRRGADVICVPLTQVQLEAVRCITPLTPTLIV